MVKINAHWIGGYDLRIGHGQCVCLCTVFQLKPIQNFISLYQWKICDTQITDLSYSKIHEGYSKA